MSPCCVGWAPNNEGICEECSPGNYQDLANPGDSPYTDGTSCQECPEGSVSVQIETINGYDSCEECPAGAFAAQDTCVQCPTGFYGANGFCLDCIEGKHAPSIGSQYCPDCPAGRFTSVNNTQDCTACPAGESTNNVAGSTVCTGCAPGLRSAIGAAECTATCPTGGQDASAVCNTCSVGNEWSGAACVACSTGQFKFDTPSCIDCPSTQVSNAARDGCEDCSSPQQSLAGVCTDCPAGYKYATDQCLTCIGGKYQDQPGLTSCKECTEGRSQNQLSQTDCIDCPRGFFNVGLSNLECETCPEGKVSGLTSNSCTACPSDQGPSATLDFCAPCQAGKEVSLLSPFVCNDCSVGKSNNVVGAVCDWCLANTYQDQAGQSSCKTCTGAGFQTNIDGIGSTACDETDNPRCAKGEYFATIVSECADCPAGKFGLGGQATECSDCPAGFVSIEASSDCTLCKFGRGANVDLVDINSVCIECIPGNYERNGVCTACPAGFNQESYSQTHCEPCPQFEESPPNSALCTPCTVDQHTIIENGRCSTCQSGKVYLGGTNLASDCSDCPPGTEPYGTTTCEPCRAHYFNINPGTYCEACPLGWSQKDTGQESCEQCTNDCLGVCPKGSIGIGSSCFPCSPGTTSLGGRETVCSNCGIGKSQPLSGQESCDSCEPGKYASEPRQSQCKLCTLGQYMAESGQGACHDCIQGTYTNQGGQTQCLTCAMGKFAEDNDAGRQGECIQCPTGWFGLSTGLCDPCPESTYQDQSNQITCKSCTVDSGGNPLQKPLSSPSSTDVSDCFDGDGLITYVFGMKDDAKEVQIETSECEIRPNMVLLCPSCSCNDNSRDGFWAGPTCNECRHGFAGGRTGKCLLKCPGYDGIHDSTMCSGNGKCWYGKYGSGQCLCGGKSILDATSDNIVVDVKTCPAGQKCNGYGDEILLETEYIPFYYLLEYRQYSVFVLQLKTFTPFRGHMWFGRFSPQTIYENVCSTCVTPYDSTEYTQIGYFNENTFALFPAESQVLNGFHGENCQHECATCVNYGKCLNTPHPYYYSYTLLSHESEVFTEVFVPQTQCICTSDIYDPDAMCCPHGFEPYVYYGKRQVTPYYQYTALPLITDVQNKQLDYWTNKDLWLQNIYPNYAQLDDFTKIQVSNINNIYDDDRGTIEIDYASNGPYTKHTFYGTEKELCRACPGLFGKGVVSRSTPIITEQDAEDFWWDTSAKGEKCNGLGVCDFYLKHSEDDVLFMGEFLRSDQVMYRKIARFNDCSSPTAVLSPPVSTVAECVAQSKVQFESAQYVIYSESYKIDVYADGAEFSIDNEWDVTNGPGNFISSLKINANAIGYVTNIDAAGIVHYYDFAMVVPGALPNPDANGEYLFHPNTEGECRYPTDALQCILLPNSAFTVYELDMTGQGDERLEEATHDRFDTCFTYTDVGKAKYRIGNYVTETYANGQDPFLGDDCPRGHFCTENSFQDNVVGFKEACPPGYYQPYEGMTRTKSQVHCSVRSSATNEVMEACDSNTATDDPSDFVDKICIRCPRHMFSPVGSRECTECSQGRIKKLSGAADINTVLLNLPPLLSVTPIPWYYIPDETGEELTDCAQIAPGYIHLPTLNVQMDYAVPEFMALASCPYSYSSDPGTYVTHGHGDVIAAVYNSKLRRQSAIFPPFWLYEPKHSTRASGEEVFELDTLQKEMVIDYCFQCPGDSVSSAASMQCSTCFGNLAKPYLKEAVSKVVSGSMVELTDCGEGCSFPTTSVRYGWESFENMQLNSVVGNPILSPENNFQVTSGMLGTRSINWRDQWLENSVSDREHFCSDQFFVELGGSERTSSSDFNTALFKMCRDSCEANTLCNFVHIQAEIEYSEYRYHNKVKTKETCGSSVDYGGITKYLGNALYGAPGRTEDEGARQCARLCEAEEGCDFFNYDHYGYAADELIDSYEMTYFQQICFSGQNILYRTKADGTYTKEWPREVDCFEACLAINFPQAKCNFFMYGEVGLDSDARHCYWSKGEVGNACAYPYRVLPYSAYKYMTMKRAPTNTIGNCYHVPTESRDCLDMGFQVSGSRQGSFYELLQHVRTPKGQCCEYTSQNKVGTTFTDGVFYPDHTTLGKQYRQGKLKSQEQGKLKGLVPLQLPYTKHTWATVIKRTRDTYKCPAGMYEVSREMQTDERFKSGYPLVFTVDGIPAPGRSRGLPTKDFQNNPWPYNAVTGTSDPCWSNCRVKCSMACENSRPGQFFGLFYATYSWSTAVVAPESDLRKDISCYCFYSTARDKYLTDYKYTDSPNKWRYQSFYDTAVCEEYAPCSHGSDTPGTPHYPWNRCSTCDEGYTRHPPWPAEPRFPQKVAICKLNRIKTDPVTSGFTLNQRYKEIELDPGFTITTADAILLCNNVYPDQFGWDFVGSAKHSRVMAMNKNYVRCAQHEPEYSLQTSCPIISETQLPITSLEECRKILGTNIQILEIIDASQKYGCHAPRTLNAQVDLASKYNHGPWSFNSFVGNNNDDNRVHLCKQRKSAAIAFTHWDTTDYSAFSRVMDVGNWGESSFPFCQSCGPGEKRSADGLLCEGCSQGQYTSTITMASQKQCIFCPAGQYQYSLRGTYCLKCPVGFTQSGTGKETCSACAAGKFASDYGSTNCMSCEVGRYQSENGKSECIDCGLGKVQSSTTSTECDSCLQGQFQNGFGKETCILCLPGLFQPAGAQPTCKECPSGYFIGSSGQTSCTACAVGFAISSSGSVGPTCDACSVGKFAENEGSGSCTTCSPGHRCSASGQAACGPGTFADGVIGRETCEQCPPGKASENIANSVCIACPNGKAINAAQTECLDCKGRNYDQVFPSPLVSGNSGINSGVAVSCFCYRC